MKPAPFEYVAARSVEEALSALDADGARVLAGGQSLVALLNARRVRPARLVDINGAGLGVIRRTDGVLRIGATVRQAALLRSRLIAEHWPLLATAAAHVGHAATRSRGTVGGSVVNADPRAELPLALAALDVNYRVRGPGLLVEITVPPLPEDARGGFAEHRLTHGQWAAAAAAVVLAPGHAAVAVLGAGRARDAERALVEGASALEAAAIAAQTVEGGHARALAAEVTRRALVEAGRP